MDIDFKVVSVGNESAKVNVVAPLAARALEDKCSVVITEFASGLFPKISLPN
jgi:hypothetical protein